MRILDRSNVLQGLDRLGLSDDHLKTIRHLLGQPNGMVIACGPTGCGKTTTLYSMLKEVDTSANTAMTIEDPVEYVITGVNHSHVNKKIGYTFPTALRAFLRHDPDIIMVGAIRDRETLEICAEAAITGHLVLSTLHVNDAVGAIQRLRDVGLEDFLISATLIGIVAQRLVRRVCESCKTEVVADPKEPALKSLGITAEDLKSHKIYVGGGCERCRNTGYRCRAGIYEVLEIDRNLSSVIGEGATYDQLIEAARAKGFREMLDDAKQKVLDGITTPQEALRVLALS